MGTRRASLVVLLLVAVVAAACGDADGIDTTTTTTSTTTGPGATSTTMPPTEDTVTFAPDASEARLDLDRVTKPGATDADLAAVVSGDGAFAFDLFGATAGDTNLIVSPYSIAAALTMTYEGARGQTRTEMAEVLRVADEATVHAARNLLDVSLEASANEPHREEEPPPLRLAVANSLWGQRDYPFVEEFLETLALNYGAGMRLVDYVSDAEAARLVINQWVEDQTNERIVDLIGEGVLTTDTRLTLVNAIWFKATWLYKFDEDETSDETFHLLDGTSVSTPTMHSSIQVPYGSGPGYQAVRLPYVGDASMTLIVPDEGAFTRVAGGLTHAGLEEIVDGMSGHLVTLALPKFEFRSELELNEILAALGMPSAFQPPPTGADFTGISPIPELFITDVLHQAFITLDENGTEAAAATAVVVGRTSLPPEAELTIDRPFVFVITHDTTGEILFLGQVTNPAA